MMNESPTPAIVETMMGRCSSWVRASMAALEVETMSDHVLDGRRFGPR